MNLLVVDILKFYAGRLRPDYISRLERLGYRPQDGNPDPQDNPKWYCDLMRTEEDLRQGRLSFPSGHSGAYFAIFTVLTGFAFTHLRPFARQGSFLRLFLALTPLTVAFLCAVSRTRNNKHHFSDIVAGAGMGMGAAILALCTTFRVAGGPLTIYLARSEVDVEYLVRYRPELLNRGGIHSNASLSSMRVRKVDSTQRP
ncbi:unnamed protein product [Phytomonas sp. Hart1]|nr:unnamed protein product [Phytomonas sp. Hart1]|eukprot:CCW71873.1 unnamed protein product [Phytomonas sp. isolate Hart1]